MRLDGMIHAQVVQTCVVSLQPVPATISEGIAMNFAEDADEEAAEVEITYDLDDSSEPIVNGRIDLGEAVAQQLALALDSYPRAPGAEIPAAYVGEGTGPTDGDQSAGPDPDAPTTANPFSLLGKIKI